VELVAAFASGVVEAAPVLPWLLAAALWSGVVLLLAAALWSGAVVVLVVVLVVVEAELLGVLLASGCVLPVGAVLTLL